jgi:glycerol-1-phosphate dehydrogenase [NAD(P)+]
VAPEAVIGDTAVLQGAPMAMMAAGLGDVFGKITARIDWIMANRILGEYRCETVAGIMQKAVDSCMAAAPGLPGRGAQAVEGLMNALTLSGIAMQMVKDSRPASGAEHQIAHFFEMLDMARGKRVTLHGDKVGVAELIVMRLYEKLFEPGSPVLKEPSSWSSRASLGTFFYPKNARPITPIP